MIMNTESYHIDINTKRKVKKHVSKTRMATVLVLLFLFYGVSALWSRDIKDKCACMRESFRMNGEGGKIITTP